jgi:hypothetical protein
VVRDRVTHRLQMRRSVAETSAGGVVVDLAADPPRAALIGRLDGAGTYWFIAGRRRVHKTVHHFLLIAEGGKLSTADPEVNEVAWVPADGVANALAYGDERTVAAKVPPLLAERA